MPVNKKSPRGHSIKTFSKQTKAHAIHLRQKIKQKTPSNKSSASSASFMLNLHHHHSLITKA